MGSSPEPQSPLSERDGITIHDTSTGPFKGKTITQIDAGPVSGDILNHHYFPAIIFYNNGNYFYAMEELDYFIRNSQFTEMNPRQPEFYSTAHYLRGAIFLKHATGVRRFSLARLDFEASIKWDKRNYLSYEGLSDVFSNLGYKDKAIEVLLDFIRENPNSKFVPEANQKLDKIRNAK